MSVVMMAMEKIAYNNNTITYPPMQVPDVPGWHVKGDWIDTVSILGQADIKFRTDRFGGNYFMHCHVLEHADGKYRPSSTILPPRPYLQEMLRMCCA